MKLLLSLFILLSLSINAQIPRNSEVFVYMKSGEVFNIETYRKVNIGNNSIRITKLDSGEDMEITSKRADSIICHTTEKVKIKGKKQMLDLRRKFVFYKAAPDAKNELLVEELVSGKLTVYRHTTFQNGYYNDANVYLYVLKPNMKTLKFRNRFAYYLKKTSSKTIADCPELFEELKKQKRFSDDDVIDYYRRYNESCG